MKENKLIHRHYFNFSPKENGGECFSLVTEFFDNGDEKDNIYINQTFSLNSYCNCAQILLCGIQITPQILRKLADELSEAKIIAYNNSLKNNIKKENTTA